MSHKKAKIIFCFILFFCLYHAIQKTNKDDVNNGGVFLEDKIREFSDNENIFCRNQDRDYRKYIQDEPAEHYTELSVIFFITPTYPRSEQFAELTRLGHTLMLVPRIHWIVANDADVCDDQLEQILVKSRIPFTYLASPMPRKYRNLKPRPRGVSNRRAAVKWLRLLNPSDGVLYFGDDDNTYDLRLFSELRQTRTVSMFPVGLIGKYAVSSPIVVNTELVSFYDGWWGKRKWPVDMAGFAVNVQYLFKYPDADMPFKAGYEEDGFLRSLNLEKNEIQLLAKGCTEILVWHTRTLKNPQAVVYMSTFVANTTNLRRLLTNLMLSGACIIK